MKNVILGTAGHVDHGKTALIRALTGIDTDRLVEEKKRGITIELGFAHLDFDDGLQVGIVDVPGHEKFIKNMLAGAGGIDLGMLIIAANEGVMPQTIEHLNILRLLGIKDGLVVITKIDMVDEEWLELVKEDAAELVKGTYLEDKPVMAVSAHSGAGIAELKQELHRLVLEAEEKNLKIPFRLPVDRVFPVEGFGTVVTGTLIEGGVQVGDVAEILPSGLTAKVRSLQVHGKDVAIAGAGQRVAINLAGIKKDEIQRGDVVAKPGSVRVGMMLDVRLDVLPDSRRTVKNQSVVHFFHGAQTTLAKVVLLDKEELKAGESGYAQLRMMESIAAKTGDRFVLRFYSPMETVGGGVILDDAPDKHKRNVSSVLKALEIKESGSADKKIVQTVAEQGIELPSAAQIAKILHMEEETLLPELPLLVNRGLLMEPLPGRYIAPDVLDTYWSFCEVILADYHKANPLHAGIRLPQLRQKLFKKGGQSECDAVLRCFAAEEKLRFVTDRAALFDFAVVLTKRQRNIQDKLIKLYRDAGINTPNLDDIYTDFAPNERDDAKKVLESLVSSGELVMLTPQICLHKTVYDDVWEKVLAYFDEHEDLPTAHFRDMFNTSRKYALAILEYYDKQKLTRYENETRRLIWKR